MSNIKQFKSGEQLDSEACSDALRDALAVAEDGGMTEVVIVYTMPDKTFATQYAGSNRIKMLGALRFAEHDIVSDVMQTRDDLP